MRRAQKHHLRTPRRHAPVPIIGRPVVEPVEIENPLNRALDGCEAQVRDIVASGGEAALRARLARLLPNGNANEALP